MSTVVVLGSDARYVRSKLALSYTQDTTSWTTPTVYTNNIHNQVVAMVKVDGYYIASTSTGTIMAGSRLDGIGEGPSISGTNAWFTPTSMVTDGAVVLIAGLYRYPDPENPTSLLEAGVVFTNQENDALIYVDSTTLLVTSVSSPETVTAYQGLQCIIYYPLWNMPTADSVLYSVKYLLLPYSPSPPNDFAAPLWIACGRKDAQHGGIWWSKDQITWTELPLPEAFTDRTVFDVTLIVYAGDIPDYRLYFSCWGVILNVTFFPDLDTATWGSSQELVTTYAQPDLYRIATNNRKELLAVASGGIFFSADGVNWTRFSKRGYQFRGAAWNNDTWTVGSESLLQTNQTWTSTDGVTWTGNTTYVNAQDVTVVG